MKPPPSRRLAPALVLAALGLAAPPARAAPPGSPWGEKYFPDVPLVTHEGREVRFYSDLIRGKLVVVNFIYTRCPAVCGLMTANLARVKRELGDRVGKDIHFYSLSLEPEHDTPETLSAYAKAYRAGPGWTFLTGKPEDIARLRRKFGDIGSVEDHAPRINVGNDVNGTWWNTAALDDPRYLATVIGAWMDPSFDGRARVAARGYARAPGVGKGPPGQAVFKQKCAACHEAGGRSVGPDLAGVVERRGEDWLRRWLRAPDRMIREKDPVAVELLARHGNVAMPNLDLTEGEIENLVEFMRAAEKVAREGRPATAPVETGN